MQSLVIGYNLLNQFATSAIEQFLSGTLGDHRERYSSINSSRCAINSTSLLIVTVINSSINSNSDGCAINRHQSINSTNDFCMCY